jgi:hypothetical protein
MGFLSFGDGFKDALESILCRANSREYRASLDIKSQLNAINA